MTATQDKSGSPAKPKPKPKPKKRAPRRRRATAPKANGKTNGAPAPAAESGGRPAVGAVVEVAVADVATMTALMKVRDDHQQKLGIERNAFLTREGERRAALQKANADYEAIVMAVARKLELVQDDEAWRYDPEQNSFIRTS